METQIIIAVDGFASCGKSTLAKALAKALNYIYIDTGAMYRAVTLHFLENKVDIKDEQAVQQALTDINIRFQTLNKKNTAFLNGKNVEDEIRKMYVSEWVSEVAAISAVRRALVKQQREMGQQKGVILDGRDIGTVVFPDAKVKFFMTATLQVRTLRRLAELQGQDKDLTPEVVAQNLQHRDHIDSTRKDSPLRRAQDAVIIDNSNITQEEQLAMCLALIDKRILNIE